MEASEQVVELFHRHIESCMYTMESLCEELGKASQLIVECMLNERKIICCGEGSQALIAQHLSSNLLNHFQHERPALPAMNLCSDAASMTAIALQSGYNDIYANQIRALGQAGDCLFLPYQGSGSPMMLRCIQAAQERQLRIITMSNSPEGSASAILQPEDIELVFPVKDTARLTEMQLVAVHAICELIDTQLFGHMTPEQ
ncbi:SIS domain-containing protein [Spongiibacter sp. KMU-158]|uniref:SIS domain-containing protein n=1 Tax=Spongiibacter pelagi TaxID=2760804 RepID=A0A927GX82_9GAMM|nr:SIS domain-containing protein [Spongiibacter pelagi]MBD2859727.1 SIS domain-containing protein [Spongiibacter pelagi]